MPAGYDGAGSLFALGLRLTLLGSAGVPLVGASNGYKTDALATINVGLEYEDGEEITQKSGSGAICFGYRAPDTVKRGTIEELQVCTPDPNVLKFVQGGNVFETIGTAEVQTVTITGTPTGGDLTLTLAGETTGAIAYNAVAGAVQTALEALAGVEPGEVTVTGGPGPDTPWVVTFTAAQGNVGQMTANGAGLTGGVAPAVAVTTTTPGVAPAAIGYQAPQVGVDPQPNGVAVEFWTNAITDGAFAADLPYIHWLLPLSKLRQSNALAASASNPMLPTFEGYSLQSQNWGDGPLGDWDWPSDRVWQWVRVATLPDLSPGYYEVAA